MRSPSNDVGRHAQRPIVCDSRGRHRRNPYGKRKTTADGKSCYYQKLHKVTPDHRPCRQSFGLTVKPARQIHDVSLTRGEIWGGGRINACAWEAAWPTTPANM